MASTRGTISTNFIILLNRISFSPEYCNIYILCITLNHQNISTKTELSLFGFLCMDGCIKESCILLGRLILIISTTFDFIVVDKHTHRRRERERVWFYFKCFRSSFIKAGLYVYFIGCVLFLPLQYTNTVYLIVSNFVWSPNKCDQKLDFRQSNQMTY